MGPCFERSNKNSRREYLQNELGCVGVLLMPILGVVVAAAFSKPWAGIKCLDLSFARSVPTTHPKKGRREHIRPHLTLYRQTRIKRTGNACKEN